LLANKSLKAYGENEGGDSCVGAEDVMITSTNKQLERLNKLLGM